MMKRTICIIIFLLLIPSISMGEGDVRDLLVEEQLDLFNTHELEKLTEEVLRENNLVKGINFREALTRLIKGEKAFDSKEITKALGTVLLNEVKINFGFLSKILVITLISAILTNLQGTFENSTVSSLANYVTYMVIAILIIGSFNQLMDVVKDNINLMVSFMEILLPILLTFLIIAGGPSTKLLFHPMIIGVVNIIGVLVKSLIFPLIYFSFIVSILSNLSQRIELKKLTELGRQVITFVITAVFTIFVGIISIYGLSTKIDGISIRTAKFAVDQFVPIVGGFLSDAVETVIGSSAILKNGIGIIGLFILILIIIFPIIKITVLLLVYKLIGAVIEPIVSSNISNFFSDMSKTLLMILISMVAVGIMFFITITIIVDTGNSLLMLR
jgi:stage III sporulation protein AE